MALSVGARVGPYEILAPLGAGGMGEVYRARDHRLDRDVAIKVLPEHLSQQPQALQRFIREMKALAALSHPNLLAIYDTGTEGGVSYAVTELLEGESLRTRLTQGALPWRKAVEITVAVAEGLAAAHSKGVTHRDVKPDNIFLTSDGQTKVLDFGLALIGPLPSESPEVDEVTRTAAGTVMGTPGYMSPEQIRGGTAGPSSDLFSLGCVLYETIAGRRAFAGDSVVETMSSILREAPAALQVPADLQRVIDHCLEKNPQARFQSALDLGFQLKAILNATGSGPVSTSGAIDSIAVLPFSNASNDPDAEYLSDGITESILNSLTQIAQLRVTPRSTVFRYKGKTDDPQALGRELNVRVVLTGRVIQRGETLVVGTELLDVQAGSQLWGERYNRKVADIFALEEEIARKISDSLRVKLTGEENKRLTKRFTENTEAYQLYLKGRHHWIRRTPDQLKTAAEYFQKAIEKDPSYALAYSGLADCYSILGVYSILPTKETLARAKAAAAAAVAFDDQLAEGHASLGFIHSAYDVDLAGADREFRRALGLNPGYWVTPYWYAMFLTQTGRFEDAEQQIRHATELEPLSPVVAHGAAMNSLMAGRTKEAIERCKKGLANDPNHHFILHMWMGVALQCEGRHDEAIEQLEQAVARGGRDVSWAVGALGYGYALAGRRADALATLKDLQDRADHGSVDCTAFILVYAGLGDVENALAWTEKGGEIRGMLPILIKGDPRLDSLRSEPRFQAVLRRLNLTS